MVSYGPPWAHYLGGYQDHSFFIGNKNLSEVKDKEEKQDISEISDQIQKTSN
jgi:hypothetical protein